MKRRQSVTGGQPADHKRGVDVVDVVTYEVQGIPLV